MAKPKLALIPATQGSKLYSVLPADGVGDFTFSRNSAATRINKDGLIETVASGVSRLNYPLIDGVVNGCPSHLLEPQRLQLIQYSEDFSQGYWTKSGSSVVSGFVSPKGDLSAFKLVESSSTSTHSLNMAIAETGNDYSFSVFAKKGEREFISLVLSDNTRYLSQYTFDLTNGIVTKSYNYTGVTSVFTYIELSNGWYKISLSSNYTWNTIIYPRIYIEETGTPSTAPSNTYTGDGTSGIYLFGAQLEQGSYPTSYIPNYGTSAGITRSAETANGAGNASTFNDSEGVLMADALSIGGVSDGYISVSDSTSSNRIAIRVGYNNSNQVSVFMVSNNSIQFEEFYNVGSASLSNFNKIALKYKQNSISLFFNGFEVIKILSASMGVGYNTLNFSNATGGTQPFYGNTKQIQYFDSALNDSDLEKITSWTSFTDLANGQQYSIK